MCALCDGVTGVAQQHCCSVVDVMCVLVSKVVHYKNIGLKREKIAITVFTKSKLFVCVWSMVVVVVAMCVCARARTCVCVCVCVCVRARACTHAHLYTILYTITLHFTVHYCRVPSCKMFLDRKKQRAAGQYTGTGTCRLSITLCPSPLCCVTASHTDWYNAALYSRRHSFW